MNNEETFDWKEAAKLWTEGKRLEVKQNYSYEWKPLVIDESASFYSFYSYRLRPEPVEPVKWGKVAYWDKDNKRWCLSASAYKGAKHYNKTNMRNETAAFFPARFDSEGYLIIPDEFKGLK